MTNNEQLLNKQFIKKYEQNSFEIREKKNKLMMITKWILRLNLGLYGIVNEVVRFKGKNLFS